MCVVTPFCHPLPPFPNSLHSLPPFIHKLLMSVTPFRTPPPSPHPVSTSHPPNAATALATTSSIATALFLSHYFLYYSCFRASLFPPLLLLFRPSLLLFFFFYIFFPPSLHPFLCSSCFTLSSYIAAFLFHFPPTPPHFTCLTLSSSPPLGFLPHYYPLPVSQFPIHYPFSCPTIPPALHTTNAFLRHS